MSERQPVDGTGVSGGNIWNAVNAGLDKISPKLVQEVDSDGDGEIEIRREVEPLVVTRLGGTLPWDRDSMQLQCGETVSSAGGDENLRLVMEAVVTNSQRETLMDMREYPEELRLISAAYTGDALFDELKWDRIADANGAVTKTQGRVDEPLYEIQLQSKETQG